MNLKEALQLHQGCQVKVGADTSFIYCSICDDKIFDVIQKMSDERYDFIIERKKIYTNLFNKKAFEKKWEKMIKFRMDAFEKRLLKNGKAITPEAKQKHLDYLKFIKHKQWRSIELGYERYTKYVKEWQPYLEREVYDIYDGILYDCKIIRFVGPEVGQYWDREEYENAKNIYTN